MTIALRSSELALTFTFEVGTSVDVKNRFIGTWSSGFEVAGLAEQGYLIRRLSDGSVLPDALSFSEVRAL